MKVYGGGSDLATAAVLLERQDVRATRRTLVVCGRGELISTSPGAIET